jgi:lipoprotein-anchoring transpeptidase ErfK/SrfK
MVNLIGSSRVAWLGVLFASAGLSLGTAFTTSYSRLSISHFSYRSFNPDYFRKVETPQQVKPRKKIIIYLSEQRLYAWEDNKLVYSMLVSTGKRSTPTIKGKFVIGAKYRYARMRGPGYDIPNVPYTMYFYNGYAIHGAFWHNRFGTPVSHGCVNLPVKQARKLFNWANVGTAVVVQN